MLQTVIIDDQVDAIEALEKLIHNFPNKFTIVGRFQTVDDAVMGITELHPDVVFLDVEIHNRTGFDVLECIKLRTFQVVFTTAYSKYAFKAFQFSALHYLLKPIGIEDFIEVVNRLQTEDNKLNLNKKIEILLHNNRVGNRDKKIIIDTIEGAYIINASKIIYCLSDGNYTDIHQIEHRKIKSSKTLKKFEGMLTDFDFFRIDQKALINLNFIEKLTRGNPTYAVMMDNAKLKVAINRKPALLKKLKNKF